jgi:hypothetical protein
MAEQHTHSRTRVEERYVDPVIEAYKKDVDRTLIRHMLTLSVEERLISLERTVKDLAELRQAAIAATTR